MTSRELLGPFKPGPGGMPPYLAGRESEQEILGALLRLLAERKDLPGEVILHGPRGNGKTVLLRWLKTAAAALGVEAVTLLPAELQNEAQLAQLLRPHRWWHRLAPREIGAGGISWKAQGGETGLSSASAVLEERAAKTPLLLVVDEAHTLDLAVGKALLQASQFARERVPFLMVLAGTPHLEARLRRMQASFWGRAREIRIGRLARRATEEAFERPFEAEGSGVDDSVLAEVVQRSHGYPYFIQLLGEATWRAAGGPGRITTGVFEDGLPRFEAVRNRYYRQRYDELREEGLLAVGQSVASAFAGREFLDDEALTAAIREATDSSALSRAEGVLSDLGFVWRTGGEPGWEPGIPSLMDYVAEHAPQ